MHDDDMRPGLDDDDILQTRLMTRRLARSESSPVLVVPIAMPYAVRVPTPTTVTVPPRPTTRRWSVVTAAAFGVALALVVLGTCEAAGLRGSISGSKVTKRAVVAAPAAAEAPQTAIVLSPASVPSPPPVAAPTPAPPATGIPNGESLAYAGPRPPAPLPVAPLALAARRTATPPARSIAPGRMNPGPIAAPAAAKATVKGAPGDDLVSDAKNVAREASDAIGATL